MEEGTITEIRRGSYKWEIEGFTTLRVSGFGCHSAWFPFAGGHWRLSTRRVSPQGSEIERIHLRLQRYGDGPLTLSVEYTFSVRHRQERNRMEFGRGHDGPWIPIRLHGRMSDWVPADTLTVICHIQCMDPTPAAGGSSTSNCSYCGGPFNAGSISSHQEKCLDKPIRCPECSDVVLLRNWYDHECNSRSAQDAAQLKEKLQKMSAELAENQSELVRSQHLVEELNLKVFNLETDRDNAQKLLQTKSKDCNSGSSSLLHSNKLMRDFQELFLGKEECDVVLRVQGQEFPAHRIILMARSPVLASTFRSDMKERATGVVEIEDCDPSSFADFLRYLYCGAVENLSPENVFDLFSAADKYDVRDLRSECLEFLKENLSVDTFCDTITLALRHTEKDLIDLATDFFSQNALQIIVTVKWQQFSADNPTESNELFVKLIVPNKNSNS